jgi:hypothetical protein
MDPVHKVFPVPLEKGIKRAVREHPVEDEHAAGSSLILFMKCPAVQ